MSFWTVVKEDAGDVENAVVSGAKTVLNYVDNVVVHDFVPALETALLQALEKYGQEALAALLAKLGDSPAA